MSRRGKITNNPTPYLVIYVDGSGNEKDVILPEAYTQRSASHKARFFVAKSEGNWDFKITQVEPLVLGVDFGE